MTKTTDYIKMTQEEAISYCYDHKDQYIKEFNSVSEGVRAFDCLICMLEENSIKPIDLPSYGMDYPL